MDSFYRPERKLSDPTGRKKNVAFESEQAERTEHVFEYKTAEGKKICDAKILYGQRELLPGSETEYGRRIEGYALVAPPKTEGQEGSPLDLMAFWNSQLKEAIPAFVVDRKNEAVYYPYQKFIALSQTTLEDPLGLATLAHEFGHARQYEDPLFTDVIAVARRMRRYLKPDSSVPVSTYMRPDFFTALSRIVPEKRRQEVLDTAQAIEEKSEEALSVKVTIRLLKEDQERVATQEGLTPEERLARLKSLEQQIDAEDLRLEHVKLEFQSLKGPLFAFFELAQQMKERNASAYELRDLRTFRDKHEIDFFTPLVKKQQQQQPWEARVEQPDLSCESSIHASINEALATYGAKMGEMIDQYGTIPSPYVRSLPDVWEKMAKEQSERLTDLEAIRTELHEPRSQGVSQSVERRAVDGAVTPNFEPIPATQFKQSGWQRFKNFLNGR